VPDRQRGDVEFAYPNGYFSTHAHFSSVQLYHLYEREISVSKPLPPCVCDTGYLLIFCMTGKGSVTANDYTLPFASDDVLIIPANYRIQLTPSADSRSLRYICLNYSLNNTAAGGDKDDFYTYFSSIRSPLLVENARFLRQNLSLFIAELCTARSSDWLIMGYLDQLMVAIRRAGSADYELSDDNSAASQAVGHTVYAIICYIDEHLYTMNNLMDMARDLGYSYNYLSHVFRKKTGITIQSYVSRKKIERSTELLRVETYSITEIASMLNYDCIQSFSKAFRKVMNMSPTEYRAVHGITD